MIPLSQLWSRTKSSGKLGVRKLIFACLLHGVCMLVVLVRGLFRSAQIFSRICRAQFIEESARPPTERRNRRQSEIAINGSSEKQYVISRIVCYHLAMGIRNYLIEGVSGTGKTSVCNELQRRGYHAVNGDRELAYQGNPETGKPMDGLTHEHHIWHVDRVKALVANQDEAITFFCGGSRNFSKFIDLFDGV